MKRIRHCLCSILALLLMVSSAVPAMAADGNVTYKGTAEKFIFAPGSGYSPTDLFPNFKNVMPGDRLTQKITVKNDTANKVKIRLYMRALGAHEDSVEFLSQLKLTVKQGTDTILFEAPADQTAQLTDWTYLGLLYSGGETELEVTLEVPVELDNRYENAVGCLDWEFMVEEYPVESTDPKPPKTGDAIRPYIGGMLGSGACLLILLVCRKKKKKENA